MRSCEWKNRQLFFLQQREQEILRRQFYRSRIFTSCKEPPHGRISSHFCGIFFKTERNHDPIHKERKHFDFYRHPKCFLQMRLNCSFISGKQFCMSCVRKNWQTKIFSFQKHLRLIFLPDSTGRMEPTVWNRISLCIDLNRTTTGRLLNDWFLVSIPARRWPEKEQNCQGIISSWTRASLPLTEKINHGHAWGQ